jgi:hypothetical protein
VGSIELDMKFQPISAASIFLLAANSPLIFATALISAWSPIVIAVVAMGAAIMWCMFFIGATIAHRPHTPKSILWSVILTWSFSFSINGLATFILPTGGPWLGMSVVAVSMAFVFLAGWRLPPATVVPDQLVPNQESQ